MGDAFPKPVVPASAAPAPAQPAFAGNTCSRNAGFFPDDSARDADAAGGVPGAPTTAGDGPATPAPAAAVTFSFFCLESFSLPAFLLLLLLLTPIADVLEDGAGVPVLGFFPGRTGTGVRCCSCWSPFTDVHVLTSFCPRRIFFCIWLEAADAPFADSGARLLFLGRLRRNQMCKGG